MVPLLVGVTGDDGRVDRAELPPLDGLQRLGAQLGREVDQIVARDSLQIERRRLRRERLRLGRPLLRDLRLRDRLLFQRPHRAAVGAVEHVGEGLLGQLHHRAHGLPVHVEVDENRRRRHVVVPDVVVDQLLVPDHLAGLDVQADQRAREEVVAGPVSAVDVVGGRFHAQVHVAQRRIGAERAPDAGVAGVLRRIAQPRLGAGLALAWNGVERPQLLPRADVEGHDVALHVGDVDAAARRQRGADHDHVVRDHRRRTVADPARWARAWCRGRAA